MENKISRWAVIVLAATCMLLLGACSHPYMYPYDKDRPYDPNFTSDQLADQIPNWEGEALRKRACSVPKAERYSWMRDQDCGD